MVVLPLILAWLSLAADPSPSGLAASGYLPTGSPVELHDLGRLARLRDPRVSVIVHETSIPRGGRDATGGTIIAERGAPASSAGSSPRPAPARPSGMRARSRYSWMVGRRPPSTSAARSSSPGGIRTSPCHWWRPDPPAAIRHVPIAFRDGCKVVVVGGGDRPYLVDLMTLPDAEGIRTFTATPTEAERLDLERARRLWSNPRRSSRRRGRGPGARRVHRRRGGAAEHAAAPLPRRTADDPVAGGSPDPGDRQCLAIGGLRLIWDAEDPAAAGVDLPLGLAFGHAAGAGPYRSAMTGKGEAGWYNTSRCLTPPGVLRSTPSSLSRAPSAPGRRPGLTRRGVLPRRGPTAPAQSGVRSNGRTSKGRGHYVGAFWELEHEGRPDAWPKGPIVFAVDGRAAFPGENRGEFPTALPGLSGGLTWPVTYPLHGVTALRTEGEAMRIAAYRWHLAYRSRMHARSRRRRVAAAGSTHSRPSSGIRSGPVRDRRGH